MQQKNINKRFKNTAPAPSTEKASLELKSLSKGQQYEQLVAQFFIEKGWSLMCKNKKFFGVETDLIIKKNQIYLLIEVKSLRREFLLEKIISPKQKKRLKKVYSMLANEFEGHWYLLLATVNNKQKINFFDLLN
ncbi:MAG: YraN family protein [Bdellovibrionales bacterium]